MLFVMYCPALNGNPPVEDGAVLGAESSAPPGRHIASFDVKYTVHE
jgi:hypothetical protein